MSDKIKEILREEESRSSAYYELNRIHECERVVGTSRMELLRERLFHCNGDVHRIKALTQELGKVSDELRIQTHRHQQECMQLLRKSRTFSDACKAVSLQDVVDYIAPGDIELIPVPSNAGDEIVIMRFCDVPDVGIPTWLYGHHCVRWKFYFRFFPYKIFHPLCGCCSIKECLLGENEVSEDDQTLYEETINRACVEHGIAVLLVRKAHWWNTKKFTVNAEAFECSPQNVAKFIHSNAEQHIQFLG